MYEFTGLKGFPAIFTPKMFRPPSLIHPRGKPIRDTLFSIIEKRETARCAFTHFLSLHSRILSRLQRRRRKSAKKNGETLQEDFYSQWIKV